jgi:hypothetical protein
MNLFKVDDDAVRVWDPVAGHFTLSHVLTTAAGCAMTVAAPARAVRVMIARPSLTYSAQPYEVTRCRPLRDADRVPCAPITSTRSLRKAVSR